MMMKKIAAAALSLLACMALGAQENAADIKAEYERQVRYVGLAGVGVETIINRWEAAAPEDPEVYVARFNYWLSKSAAESVVITRPMVECSVITFLVPISAAMLKGIGSSYQGVRTIRGWSSSNWPAAPGMV